MRTKGWPLSATDPAPDEDGLRVQLNDFVKEITMLFDETEKGVAAHPAASVLGALIVGLLIGRFLGRREGLS